MFHELNVSKETVRTSRLFRRGALLRMDGHRSLQQGQVRLCREGRELENTGKRGPGGKGAGTEGLRARGSSGVWHHEGLESQRTKPWGLLMVQHGMRREGVAGLWPRG